MNGKKGQLQNITAETNLKFRDTEESQSKERLKIREILIRLLRRMDNISKSTKGCFQKSTLKGSRIKVLITEA